MTPSQLRDLLKAKLSKKEFEKLDKIFNQGTEEEIVNYLYQNFKIMTPTPANEYLYGKYLETVINDNLRAKLLTITKDIKEQDEFFNTVDNTITDIENHSTLRPIQELRKEALIGVANENADIVYNNFSKGLQNIFNTSITLERKGFESITNKWVKTNISLITKMEAEEVSKIGNIVKRVYLQGGRAEVIEKQIKENITNIKQSRANLIATDQTLKLHSDLNIQQQKNIGCDKYIWRTQGDGVVRESHRVRDKQEYSYNMSPLPAEEIRCRCFAVGLIKW